MSNGELLSPSAPARPAAVPAKLFPARSAPAATKLTLENVAESDGLYSVVAVHGCGGGGHFVRVVLRLPGETARRVERRQRDTGETKSDTAKGGSGGRRGRSRTRREASHWWRRLSVTLSEWARPDCKGITEARAADPRSEEFGVEK